MHEPTRILGGMAICFDDWMAPDCYRNELTNLIDGIEDKNTRAALWILTVFALGTVRRMGYAYMAGRDVARHADPQLAIAIRSDNKTIKDMIHSILADRTTPHPQDADPDADVEKVRNVALKEFDLSDDWCEQVKRSYEAVLRVIGDEKARKILKANARIDEYLANRDAAATDEST